MRISEMAGIKRDDSSSTDFWALNGVLLLLGAVIIGTAFAFLSPTDSRYRFNPWTYAICTPIALLLISVMLSSLVSRVVEKTMQIAFLLSLLTHLLFSVYAVNVVILSDLFQASSSTASQAKQDSRLKRLKAKQYHNLNFSTRPTDRPDHAKPIETTSKVNEPTLEKQSVEPPLPEYQAREQAQLLKQKTEPQLPERQQPEPAEKSISGPLLAERIELQPSAASVINPSAVPSLEEPTAERSLAPEPREAASIDRRSPQLDVSAPSPATAIDRSNPPRLEANLQRSRESDERLDLPSLSKSIAGDSDQRSNRSPSTSNPSSLVPTPQPIPSSLAANSLTDMARHEVQVVPPLPQSLQNPAKNLSPLPTQNPFIDPLARVPLAPSSFALNVPNSPTNDEPERDVAGGRTSSPPSLSLPVKGQEQSTAPRQENSQWADTDSSRFKPNGSRRGSPLSLPTPGDLQSPTWSGAPSLGNHSDNGSVPSPANTGDLSQAATADSAGLTGSGGNIQTGRGQLLAPSSNMPVRASPSISDLAFNPPSLSSDSSAFPSEQGTGSGATPPSSNSAVPSLTPSTDSGATLGSTSADNRGQAPMNSSADRLQRSTGSLSPAFPSSMGPATFGSSTSTPSNRAATGSSAAVGPRLPTRREFEPPRVMVPSPDLLASNAEIRRDVLDLPPSVAPARPAFQQRLDRLMPPSSREVSPVEPQTERAIELGLVFLKKHQRPDGSWRLQDFDTEVLMRSDTAATGLSVLSFQGAGYTHNQFKYADTVRRGIDYLIKNQKPNGDLYIKMDPASDQNAWLYSHGIATLALCEAYGMTQDEEVGRAAQLAIDFMTASQDQTHGGWRYQPGIGTDTSVTGWFMMALRSGQLAGLTVPEKTIDGIEMYLDSCRVSGDEPYLFRYNPFAPDTPRQRHGWDPTSVMTSVGLLMRLYTGWERNEEAMLAGANSLMTNMPQNGTANNSQRDTYYWYYSTQVIFHVGGDYWKQWHDRLYPMLIESQVMTGDYTGSWDPLLPTPDIWSRYGGRLYVTTLNLLSLEISYRHLPLYESALTP